MAPQIISDLVRRFDRNRDSYTASTYIEAHLRLEFINPFLEALGWDISNRQGYAEAYKEVINEDAVKVGGAVKAPDYSFRIGGTRKFFVEAKRPSVHIKDDPGPAFQLRRYAWSAKLPLSILTNFEEFAVYGCRRKPDKTDNAGVDRIQYLKYTEYVENWEQIAAVFSKDAILKGSFDHYAQTNRAKKGTAEVDDAFLAEIENWRDRLARNIALRNSGLTNRQLNFAVQRTIDRIIFLRICEDRGIEDDGNLQRHLNGDNVYRRLCKAFQDADDLYNSGLFHFREEPGREEKPDDISLHLEIDDKVLKEIIGGLYYPDCPYAFAVFPADILGQVYEQFLGKVIRLTAGHQAKVEDKPEVKKAGGVFYTPTYIVDYIVKNTVGKLLASPLDPLSTSGEGKTRSVRGEADPPAEIDLSQALPDPSPVGEGNPFPDRGKGRPEGGKRSAPLDKGGKGEMTPKGAAKLRILDPACGSGSFLIGAYQHLLDWHLAWYMKNDPEKLCKARNPVLYQTAAGEYRLTSPERKRILTNNIYGVDIDTQAVEVTKLSLLLKVLEGENAQIISQQQKLFHERALPDLGNNIKCGNSLIGTDFYHGEQVSMGLFDDEERYRINAFDWEGKGGFPEIMKAGGFDAVIGNPPYGAYFSEEEKTYLNTNHQAIKGQPESYEYFIDKSIDLCKKNGMLANIVPTNFIESERAEGLRTKILQYCHVLTISSFRYNVWKNNASETLVYVFKKGELNGIVKVIHPESEYDFSNDIGAKSFNQIDWKTTPKKRFIIRAEPKVIRKIENNTIRLESICDISQGIIVYKTREESAKNLYISHQKKAGWKKLLDTESTISRYHINWGNRYLKYGDWLWCPRENKYFENDKLLFVRLRNKSLSRKLIAVYDDKKYYNRDNFNNMILKEGNHYSLMYILALFNSTLINYWYKAYFDNVNINPAQVRLIPIRNIDLTTPELKMHDKIVENASAMLDLHKRLPTVRTDQEKAVLSRQIEATDKQIDKLVYELYGLTAEEIAIVEGSSNK